MKTILITSTYFHPYLSGLTIYPMRLAKVWLNKGYRIKVLTFKHKQNLATKEIVNKIKIQRLSPHLQLNKGLINFFYPYYALVNTLKANIVLVNLPGPENIWPSLFARLFGKKLIALYHCDLYLKQNWLLSLASFITNTSSFISCLLAKKIVNSSENYAKTSPVLKHFLKKIVFQYPLVNKAKIDKLYLTQLQKLYKGAYPLIGFVGRISSEKNLETLIKALVNLKKTYPKTKLLLAGPYAYQVSGENAYYRKILSQLNEWDINYEILGILSDERLAAFYNFINILVLPSNNRTEAYGMVQTEAMLHQTVVVASDSPGINEPIKQTKMGELFNPKSASSLTKALTKVIKNEKEYLKNAKNTKAIYSTKPKISWLD